MARGLIRIPFYYSMNIYISINIADIMIKSIYILIKLVDNLSWKNSSCVYYYK